MDVYVAGLQQLIGPNSALSKFNESRFGKRATNLNPLYAPLSQSNEHTANAAAGEYLEARGAISSSEPSGNEPEPEDNNIGEGLFQMIIGEDDDEPFGAFND
ncbi:hypothetical protein RSAG8_11937, partial [Rhizoctonia solani AG-8 WAC10335]